MGYKIALIADNHFVYGDDEKVFVNGTYTQQYLARLTSNFDNIVVIARGRKAYSIDETMKLRESGGDRVSFCFLDDFQGITGFLKSRNRVREQLYEQLKLVDAIIIRMPCVLTTISLTCAKDRNIPILIDVGADPETIYEGAANKFVTFALSKYLKSICKKSCMTANGVSYVTKQILQRKYPCMAIKDGETKEFFTASISNVDISQDFYYKRVIDLNKEIIKLVHVSNNIPSNSSKGHQEAINVLSSLIKKGYNAKLTFLGDGDGIVELKQQARQQGVIDAVEFKGRIADRNTYRSILLENDIFVFPSHSEGLPRVLLEAMATGMVCVSSNVDGIPEILESKDIFDYSNIEGMTNRIIELVNNVEEMQRVSLRNYQIAESYSFERLIIIIDNYYNKVRQLIDDKR